MIQTRTLAILSAASLALLVACGEKQATQTQIELPPAPVVAAPSAATKSVSIEGWDPQAEIAKQQTVPEFSISRPTGEILNQDKLRGHWTIVAFWGLWSEDSISEVRYMQALKSAASQDPELDFVTIHFPPPGKPNDTQAGAYGAYLSLQQGLDDQGAALPTAEDKDGSIAEAFGVTTAPTYLLIGPDLTVEARRGSLNVNDADGVKPMIRGVAEIRKQIAAP